MKYVIALIMLAVVGSAGVQFAPSAQGVIAAASGGTVVHEGWHECAGCTGEYCILGCPVGDPTNCGRCWEGSSGCGHINGGCNPAEDENTLADGTTIVQGDRELRTERHDGVTVARSMCNGVIVTRSYDQSAALRVDDVLQSIVLD